MDLEDLVLRIPKGSPLTPAEMDANLEALRDGINANAALLSVSLNPDGSLKTPPLIYGVSAVGTDAYAFTPSAGLGINAMTYFLGKFVVLLADVANAGAATLEIIGTSGGLGAKPIKKFFNQTLDDSDIKAGQLVQLSWDGTNWQMQSWPGVVQPINYALDTGVVNAYAVAQSGTINIPAALYAGYKISVKIAATNTGASTLQIGALAAASIRKNVSTVLAAGDLTVGQVVDFIYDGTNFQMVSGVRNPFADLGAQGWPAGFGTLTFVHTLGNFPVHVLVMAQPMAGQTDAGYDDTMQVEIHSFTQGSLGVTYPISVFTNANTVQVQFSSVVPVLATKGVNSLTPIDTTKWNVKVYVNNG